MPDVTRWPVGAVSYDLEIAIGASSTRVFGALSKETNAWWLDEFRMTGPGSTVRLEARAGGGLVEEHPNGESLLWYTVLWFRPAARSVHLVGHVSADFGGPSTNLLTLAVEARGAGSVLRVTEAIHGRADEASVRSLREGWTRLFTAGLATYVER